MFLKLFIEKYKDNFHNKPRVKIIIYFKWRQQGRGRFNLDLWRLPGSMERRWERSLDCMSKMRRQISLRMYAHIIQRI